MARTRSSVTSTAANCSAVMYCLRTAMRSAVVTSLALPSADAFGRICQLLAERGALAPDLGFQRHELFEELQGHFEAFEHGNLLSARVTRPGSRPERRAAHGSCRAPSPRPAFSPIVQ